MHRYHRSPLMWSPLTRPAVALAVVAFAGCAADSYGSFVVRNNLAPEEGSCTFFADQEAAFFSRGTIFAGTPSPYLLSPLIESRIVADPGKALQRTVALRGARIDLVVGPIEVIDSANRVTTVAIDPADPELGVGVGGITRFSSLFSAALAPQGSVSAQFDLIPLATISAIVARANPGANRMHAQVVATSVLFGDIQGNEIESDPYTYPVTVCNDCVVSRFPVAACPLPAATMVRTGNACNPFQDGIIDCCVDAGVLQCPGTVATE